MLQRTPLVQRRPSRPPFRPSGTAASLVSLVSAYAEVSLLKVGGRVPGIGRILILAAWLELLGSILLLIAAAIFLGGSNCGAFNFGNPGTATFNGGCRTASAGELTAVCARLPATLMCWSEWQFTRLRATVLSARSQSAAAAAFHRCSQPDRAGHPMSPSSLFSTRSQR